MTRAVTELSGIRNDVRCAVGESIASHAGWQYYRGLTQQSPAADSKLSPNAELVSQVTRVRLPQGYVDAYSRWEKLMRDDNRTVHMRATTTAPLAIGLGINSPIDVGFSLHHTYGVPYLPGSALKGLARRAAEHFELGFDHKFVLFGDDSATGSTSAGYITYWDGWIDPETWGKGPLQVDVITVHHPKYYDSVNSSLLYKDAGKKPGKIVPPTDFDDPTPIPCISVRTGVTFRIAVTCLADADDKPFEWADVAAQVLDHGLTTLGLGAKTNSGYGTFLVSIERATNQ